VFWRAVLQRIASLDGLRAVSITLVLFGHATGTLGFPIAHDRFGLADAGVRTFFIISGFLITKLLLRELTLSGTISLRGFYRRRILRIFPAFYAYCLAVLALVSVGVLAVPLRYIAYAATYTINYFPVHPSDVSHFWSLAVEEQFYALWPMTLFFLGRKRAISFAGALLVLVPLVRVAQFRLWPSHQYGIGHEFHTIADCIAVGCLLAGCQDWLWEQESYRKFLTSWTFWLAPCAIAITLMFDGQLVVKWLIMIPIFNIAMALCIDRWTRIPDADPVAVFLNWSPVAFIGVISYSLYLWHRPFVDRYSYHTWNKFPLNIVLAFFVALGSYYLIEKPFLSLRHKERMRLQSIPVSSGERRAEREYSDEPSSPTVVATAGVMLPK
jgi:peptidoglycan/LPS O-acetylase OafA/YrhL